MFFTHKTIEGKVMRMSSSLSTLSAECTPTKVYSSTDSEGTVTEKDGITDSAGMRSDFAVPSTDPGRKLVEVSELCMRLDEGVGDG